MRSVGFGCSVTSVLGLEFVSKWVFQKGRFEVFALEGQSGALANDSCGPLGEHGCLALRGGRSRAAGLRRAARPRCLGQRELPAP